MKKYLLLGIMLGSFTQLVQAQSATILPTTSTFSKNTGDFTNPSTGDGVFSLRATLTSTAPGVLSSAIRGVNNSTTANGIGVWGSHSGTGYGVYGVSPGGVGVFGNGTSSAIGVLGSSVSGIGVQGSSTSGVGIKGYSSTNIPGMFEVNNPANANPALVATTISTASSVTAIKGVIATTAPGGFSSAVRGINNGTGGLGIGVWGSHDGGGWGVYGSTTSGVGVNGNSTSGTGMNGTASSGTGVNGSSVSGVGVHGTSTDNVPGLFEITNVNNENSALIGTTNSTTSSISAVRGEVLSTAPGGFSSAVRGINNGTGGLGIGIWGSQNGSGWGIYGVTPNGLGVYGNSSAAGTGVYANSNSGMGLQATSNNGTAAAITIFNNSNNNHVLTASTVGNGNVLEANTSGNGAVIHASSEGNGSGVISEKTSPFAGAYTSDPHAELEIRHPIYGTQGMTGLRILNTSSGLNSWTLYTVSDGGLALFAKSVQVGTFNPSTGVYTNTSDARLKNNIQSYAGTLANLMKVDVKSYQLHHSNKTEIGLLAQEVLPYFPEIVYTNTDEKGGQFYTMDYARIGVLAVKAIQEQQKEIDELKKEIAELKAMIKK